MISLLVLFSTLGMAGQSFSLPDPKLTPGDIDPSLSKETLCNTKTIDRRHVTEAMKKEVFKRYGADRKARKWEVDHLISLCAGGRNTIENLWPQPWDEARIKDKLEVRLCTLACKGEIKIEDAQAALKGDFTKSFEKYQIK